MNSYTLRPFLVAFLVVFLFGCTIIHNVPQDPYTGYQNVEKYQLNIGLVKTPSLLTAKWDDGRQVGEFGSALLINTETMVHNLFKSFVTIDSVKAESALDGYLIPKVTYVDSTHGMAFDDVVTTLIVEWNFTDQKGETIWLETVEGQGVTKAGINIEAKFTERARLAIDDLFENSYRAMAKSREIKRYARK